MANAVQLSPYSLRKFRKELKFRQLIFVCIFTVCTVFALGSKFSADPGFVRI